jgi:hypothetical protein
MFIIWGSKVRKLPIASGEFFCPSCSVHRAYDKVRLAKYFTLYFIPLFETSDLGTVVECTHCESMYDPQVIGHAKALELRQAQAAVLIRLQLGSPYDVEIQKLKEAGVSDEDAVDMVLAAVAHNETLYRPAGATNPDGNYVNCPNCSEALELDDSEVHAGHFKCPVCEANWAFAART